MTQEQARDVTTRQALQATALSSSHALPLWSRKEWALASFFRACNRRGQGVLEPAASDTGGFDPVSRWQLEGRTYRLVTDVGLAIAGEFIAHLLEVRDNESGFR